MDCLDRTNVIQSLLARRSMQSQLRVGPIITEEVDTKKQLNNNNFYFCREQWLWHFGDTMGEVTCIKNIEISQTSPAV